MRATTRAPGHRTGAPSSSTDGGRRMRRGTGGAILAVAIASGFSLAPAAAGTEDRLDRLEARAQVVTDLAIEVDRLKRENRELRGMVEELENRVEQLTRRIRDIVTELDQRLAQRPAAPAPGQAPASPPTTAAPAARPVPGNAAPSPAAAPTDTAAEQAEYEAAFKALQLKKYKEAAAGFRSYLKKFPAGDNADSAYYWLGEALYVSDDDKGALAQFQMVLERFPQSSKAPNALLKIGYVQHAMGDRKKAEATLTRVVKQYPQTPAAKLAQQKLDAIRAEGR